MQAFFAIFVPVYGSQMLVSERDAATIAEPAGRILARNAAAASGVQAITDPVLVAGALATVAIPRILLILGHRVQTSAPSEQSEANPLRGEPVVHVNGSAGPNVVRTISRMQTLS